MDYCQQNKRKCRPIGSALSPNGIGFPSINGNIIFMGHFNQIKVNTKSNTVTVGAGVTVNNLLEEF